MAGHSPSGFSDRVQNAWFYQLWQVVQVLKLQSSPRPSHYHHHVWLLVWCSFYEMCWFYARCNGTHTFQKVKLLSHQSTEYLPKSLGDNQDFFWQMWDEPLCSFWSAMTFPWNSPMDVVFAQSLSYCWFMNTDLNQRVSTKRRNSDAFRVTATRWRFGSAAAILGWKFQLDNVTDIQK